MSAVLNTPQTETQTRLPAPPPNSTCSRWPAAVPVGLAHPRLRVDAAFAQLKDEVLQALADVREVQNVPDVRGVRDLRPGPPLPRRRAAAAGA